jgi:RNA polymerase sigma-70 factor (ECF subfamily)
MFDISKLPDEEVVRQVRENNKELYTEIIKRYQERLLRYANSIIGDENRSADVVQEAFINAYINLNGFDIKKNFSSWIYRIVHNQAINLLDKYKKQVPVINNLDFDSGINLEDDFIKKELKNRAHNCLSQIPLIYRESLALYFLDEKSYEEISGILKVPIGTVGTHLNRAKVIIKKICQKK